ncbi:MAG: LuxR family transcriptional regulator, partial [Candidatus Dormibacteraeota bacterium]|nr:LuxR family transcriptional regulator [Candidatus Dormibacteraeota bacterium]
GHFTEGRDRLRSLLEVVTDNSSTRVRALNGAANLAIDQGDHEEAERLLEESLASCRSMNYGTGEGMAALYLARSRVASMRAAEAVPYLEQAMASLRQAHDEPGMALCLMFSGLAAQFTEQPQLACDRFNECIRMATELRIDSLAARASQLLGIVRLDMGELAPARTALEQGLPVALELGDRFVVPIGLGGFASLAARTGKPRQAVRLAGAAAAYSETNHFSVPAVMQALLDRALAPVRKTLGVGAANLFAEGRRMKVEEAVASALANEPEEAWRPGPRRTLTRREVEVAALVAGGLTNREIAGRLHLSVRTVDVHVDHILTKLAFHTRTQLAAWAYEQDLLPRNT